jgi:hypothetical protein
MSEFKNKYEVALEYRKRMLKLSTKGKFAIGMTVYIIFLLVLLGYFVSSSIIDVGSGRCRATAVGDLVVEALVVVLDPTLAIGTAETVGIILQHSEKAPTFVGFDAMEVGEGHRPVDLQPARSRQDRTQPQHQTARRPRLPNTRGSLYG